MIQRIGLIIGWCLVVTTCGIVVAAEPPSLEELGQLLVKRSENLDRIDVTYRLETEYLFPVAGLTPAVLKPRSGCRHRTVCMGRKRRFEQYPDDGPSYTVIFDGETTADIQIKRPQMRSRGVAVSLQRGLTGRSAIDCQYCLCALGKPLSDSSIALSYQYELFPWIVLALAKSNNQPLFQLDLKRAIINDAPCYAVRSKKGDPDTYWLDSSRDFVLVRRERLRTDNASSLLNVRSIASDFRQHGEYWIPYSYEREHGAPSSAKDRAGEVYYRMKLTVDQIEIGKVTDDDFKVDLIAGAPVFDTDTGRMIENRASHLTEVGAIVAEMNSSYRPWWHWAGIAVVCILLITAIWFWKRGLLQNWAKAK